jgi:hypothetical protein
MSETNSHEADTDAPHSLGRVLLRIVGTLVGLLLLYVLSAGPAAYFAERQIRFHGVEDFPVIEKLYGPIMPLFETSMGNRYILWWVDRVPGGEPRENETRE